MIMEMFRNICGRKDAFAGLVWSGGGGGGVFLRELERTAIGQAKMKEFLKKNITLDGGWKVEYDRAACGDGLVEELKVALRGKRKPGGWNVIESSHNTEVWAFENGGERYVFKLFLPRNTFESLKAKVRKTRAERAWMAGRTLLERGLLTPPVLAWGVKSTGVLPGCNFLVTRFISDVLGIYKIFRGPLAGLKTGEGFEARRRLMYALGKTIGMLHASGIIHGDLRPDNVLVKDWSGAKPLFYFIDNERNLLFKSKALPEDMIIKNLVQLNMFRLEMLTRTDRMRFYVSYLRAFPEMMQDKKNLVTEVWRTTEERMKKKHGGLGA